MPEKITRKEKFPDLAASFEAHNHGDLVESALKQLSTRTSGGTRISQKGEKKAYANFETYDRTLKVEIIITPTEKYQNPAQLAFQKAEELAKKENIPLESALETIELEIRARIPLEYL